MIVRDLPVAIVTPAEPGSRRGNRVTALRIAAHLRSLGARPFVTTTWPPERDRPAAVLLAIHARRSAAAIAACRRARPQVPIVLVLGGTELYPQFDDQPATRASLAAADRIVGLQSLAAAALPPEFRAKVRTIEQSARRVAPPRCPVPPLCTHAVVAAHLRPIKQPAFAAAALALLPDLPQLRVDLLGSAIDAGSAAEVQRAAAREPRFRWLGMQSRRATLQQIAAADLLLVTSLGEGGAAVVSEAVAHGTPVLASAVPGNLGLLGADWPGGFAPDAPAELAALLRRAATDRAFVADLRARTAALAERVAPERERQAWGALLAGL